MKHLMSIFTRRTILIVVAFAAVLGALGYYYTQYHRLASAASAQPQQPNAAEQTAKIVGDIKKLMVISNDTGAQVAEITDVAKLAGQPFFANAQNHDYLALFPAAQKAVLYRPQENKIVEVGPFNPAANSTQRTATSSASHK